jgi:hypothetical protein
MANLDGHYMVDESTSYHEQAITTMKNGEVVETHVEERKEEQIEAPQALHREKCEEVSIETPSSYTLILKTPFKPRAPIAYDLPRGENSSLLGLLEEQKETIKVEKFLEYSPHFTQFMIPFRMRNCLRILRGIYLDMQTFEITFL